MPRRVRKGNGNDGVQGKSTAANEQALAVRIQSIFKKILTTLQDQRDLRCDLASTRTRAVLLDSEYVVLHRDYEKSVAAHERLEGLSKELARQNKSIEEEAEQRVSHERQLREDIVHRFNSAMCDINNKLARQSSSREERDKYVANMQNKVADLRERNDMREQHFEQQLHRKKLEKQLVEAKRRQLDHHHAAIRNQLSESHRRLTEARNEHSHLNQTLVQIRHNVDADQAVLAAIEAEYAANKERIDTLQAEIKTMQDANATQRNANNATLVHIKAMEAECARLEAFTTECRDVERKERVKIEALEKLCRQVTAERAGLHNDIMAMQEAWTKLKHDIDALKDQVGDSGKVFDVLQNIMNRESLDVAVSSIIKSGKTIEDVINDELSHLHLTSGVKLDASRTSVARSRATATASSARSAEAPG